MASIILATAGYDPEIRLWDVRTGKSNHKIPFSSSQVNCLAVSNDKAYLAAGGYSKACVFDTSGSEQEPLVEFEVQSGANTTAVGFQKDGRWIYCGSEDGSIKVFDARSSGVRRQYDAKSTVNAVALHPNQAQLVSVDQSGSVKVWDLIADKFLCSATPLPDDISMRSVAVSSNGTMIAAVNSVGTCFLWNMKTPQTCLSLGDHSKVVRAHDQYAIVCKFSPDSKCLATGSADHTVKIWNMPDFSLDKTLSRHERWVHDVSFSADSSYLVSASSDSLARLWDLSSGDMIKQYSGHDKAIVAVALNDIGD